MNTFGVTVIECALRATIFALLGLALYVAARRRGPAAGSLVTLATLLGLVVLSAFAISPWPRWWNVSPSEAAALGGVAPAAVVRDESGPAPSAAATPSVQMAS